MCFFPSLILYFLHLCDSNVDDNQHEKLRKRHMKNQQKEKNGNYT